MTSRLNLNSYGINALDLLLAWKLTKLKKIKIVLDRFRYELDTEKECYYTCRMRKGDRKQLMRKGVPCGIQTEVENQQPGAQLTATAQRNNVGFCAAVSQDGSG